MRVYAFTCGYVECKESVFRPHLTPTIVDLPVPFFLIQHPKGNVLVDTGNCPEAVDNPKNVWGGLNRVFLPKMTAEDLVINQIKRVGLTPEDIDYVIMTHLHMDHAGGNRFFPGSKIIVQETEYETARDPRYEGIGYYKNDWDYDLSYEIIQGDLDLFDDHKVVINYLPGHTPGHQTVRLNLDSGQTLVLAGDAVATEDNLDNGVLPKNIWTESDYKSSVAKLKELKNQGALVICGHDLEQWNTLKLVPDYFK